MIMGVTGDKSKKPSAANSPLPPEEIIFFIDRSLGRKVIPGALQKAGERVKAHDDLYPQDTKDPVWLRGVGKQGWVVLTKDKRIRHRNLELEALMNAKVRAFVLASKGDLQGQE